MKHYFIYPWRIVTPLCRHSSASFDSFLQPGTGYGTIAAIFGGLIVFWHLYVPIHELMHVLACVLCGGTVSELTIKPQYGGTLLQQIFPFVTTDSDYAGQLTGFKTPNYWAYAAVDFFPFSLSLFGVSLLELTRRKKKAIFFGLAIILIYVPLLSIFGDYYEAASLVTTQIAESLDPSLATGFLISDDALKLGSELYKSGSMNVVTGALFVSGLVLAGVLVLFTFVLQFAIANCVFSQNIAEKYSTKSV